MVRDFKFVWWHKCFSTSISFPSWEMIWPRPHCNSNSDKYFLSFKLASLASSLESTFSKFDIDNIPERCQSFPNSLMLDLLSFPTTKEFNFWRLLNWPICNGISFKTVPLISRYRRFTRLTMLIGKFSRNQYSRNNKVCKLYNLHTESGKSWMLVLLRFK